MRKQKLDAGIITKNTQANSSIILQKIYVCSTCFHLLDCHFKTDFIKLEGRGYLVEGVFLFTYLFDKITLARAVSFDKIFLG